MSSGSTVYLKRYHKVFMQSVQKQSTRLAHTATGWCLTVTSTLGAPCTSKYIRAIVLYLCVAAAAAGFRVGQLSRAGYSSRELVESCVDLQEIRQGGIRCAHCGCINSTIICFQWLCSDAHQAVNFLAPFFHAIAMLIRLCRLFVLHLFVVLLMSSAPTCWTWRVWRVQSS